MSASDEINKSLFTLENCVKGAVLLTIFYNITTGIDSIKSDVLLIKQGSRYEINQIEYRVTQIENCCNGRNTEKHLAFNQSVAIMPNTIEIEDDRKAK